MTYCLKRGKIGYHLKGVAGVMVLLKRFESLFWFWSISFACYLFLNLFIDNSLFFCRSIEQKPTEMQMQKIKQARNLFSVNPNIPEPDFMIKTGQCFNAWADSEKNFIIISQRVADEFSAEEIGGILGHEFGHLIASLQLMPEGKQLKEHWKIDIIGAGLTSKELVIKGNNRMISSLDGIFKEKKLLIYMFTFSYFDYLYIVNDYNLRNNKIKESPDKK